MGYWSMKLFCLTCKRIVKSEEVVYGHCCKECGALIEELDYGPRRIVRTTPWWMFWDRQYNIQHKASAGKMIAEVEEAK